MYNNISIKVFSENKLDYKYQQIAGYIPSIEYRHVDYRSFIVLLFKNLFQNKFQDSIVYFHIRYLKWRGYLFTIPIYIVLVCLCKVNSVKITWTCHNIHEHKFKSSAINNVLRYFIYCVSDNVIVMHSSIEDKLPKFSREKVYTASFGDFKPHFKNALKKCDNFSKEYNKWLKKRGISYPDAIYISTNQMTSFVLKKAQRDSQHNYLIIDPSNDYHNVSNNVFLFCKNFISSEVHDILNTGSPIGIIAIDNISVPTSIYMFASYGIPMLVFDSVPSNQIVMNYSIGYTFKKSENLCKKIKLIKSNYSLFSIRSDRFLEHNNWENSASIHEKIWCKNT